MIFPELGPQYYSEVDKAMISRMETFYAEAITINQAWWGEATIDTRFFCGDATIFNELYTNLPLNRRRQFNFNRIRRIINMVSGYQRKNRKSIIVSPIENGDAETADQYTKIMMWLLRKEGILETISESFLGALVTGMNLMHVWLDYRSDPISGNIRVDNCSYNSFLIDPFFRKPDLSDCNSIWKRSFLTKKECISLLPAYAEEIMGLWGIESGTGRDGKFMFMPESYGYSMKNLLTYDEFYYKDYRNQKMLIDTETGEVMEWKVENEEGLRRFLQLYPQVKVIENEVPTVRLAIVVQGKVIYDGVQPDGSDLYPFIPVFGYYSPELPDFNLRLQGMVRGLRDSQYLFTRRKIIELDILESQLTSGYIYKENALVNPKDVYLAGQGRGLALKEEAQMTDVMPIQSPQIPPTTLAISEALGKEIEINAGVNEELMGSAIDDKAGILAMLRQGAGLTTLQILFDQLDRSMKLLGDNILNRIQINFTPGKVQKILEGQQPSPQFYNKAFGVYHCVIEEGLNTSTQRQLQFAQYLQLIEAGVPIPPEQLIEAATIVNKKELIEAIQAQQQQQMQMAQQQQQVQMEEVIARTNLANARAMADEGLGIERLARADSDKALAIQKLHEANKNDEQAMLEKIKAIKELESIDLNHLKELILMSNMIKAQEQSQIEAKEKQRQEVPAQVRGETLQQPSAGLQ